ncbi:MAG: histidine kinase [Vicinamibacteria bacterium]|nr:histidine kinase [Vicinamibacteria bacterium]
MPKSTFLRRSTARKWALFALAFTIIWLLQFSIVMTNVLASHDKLAWKYPFVWEMTGAYGVFVLLPALLSFMTRYPIERRNLRFRIPLHMLANALFGVAHTLFMWGSRLALYYFLGWGRYDYGVMGYRFLMEGGKQIFTYWSVYFVFTAIKYAQQSREKERTTSRLERELVEARLSALKMQINPHFLFNTLNMISSDIEHEPRRADATLGHLSDFLRATLRHAPAQEVPLEQEIEFLGAYLEIMKARFEDRLLIEVAVPEETRSVLVPHLILQPLVENSITHCMADVSRQGRIRVASALAGERLRIVIEDNGPGLSAANDVAPSRGIGLTNTAERLRHLHGAAQRLELSNRPEGGLRLTIEIPVRTTAARYGRTA